MSDNQRPAAKQAADTAEDAPSALQAVQAALDRRDNGGAADGPPRLPTGQPRPAQRRTARTSCLASATRTRWRHAPAG